MASDRERVGHTIGSTMDYIPRLEQNLRYVPQVYSNFLPRLRFPAASDTVSISVPGMQIVVLNSFKAATDLLEKKSQIYSDRPPSILTRLYA